ncbi:PadR family transcriptional regulator [Sphingobium fuliginis]|nr:PadR family transcriptional regulator [Sphingobium fuliginis]
MAGRRTSGALEMLLLSVLADGNSLSGYQISVILAEPVSLMWAVKHSQIYPALSLLEEQGDIVGSWIVQSGRPNKKNYVISPSGIERLTQWLLQPRDILSDDEVRLIAYNLDLIGQAKVDEALAKYLDQCLEERRQLEERWLGVWNAPWDHQASEERLVGIRSLYESALATRDARIAWCNEGLDRARRAVARTRPADERYV